MLAPSSHSPVVPRLAILSPVPSIPSPPRADGHTGAEDSSLLGESSSASRLEDQHCIIHTLPRDLTLLPAANALIHFSRGWDKSGLLQPSACAQVTRTGYLVLGDMQAPCVHVSDPAFSAPKLVPGLLLPPSCSGEQGWEGVGVPTGIVAGTWPALEHVLPVLSMALYKWDFGSHLFKGADNELGGDEKNAKARRFFRMSRGLRDVKDE